MLCAVISIHVLMCMRTQTSHYIFFSLVFEYNSSMMFAINLHVRYCSILSIFSIAQRHPTLTFFLSIRQYAKVTIMPLKLWFQTNSMMWDAYEWRCDFFLFISLWLLNLAIYSEDSTVVNRIEAIKGTQFSVEYSFYWCNKFNLIRCCHSNGIFWCCKCYPFIFDSHQNNDDATVNDLRKVFTCLFRFRSKWKNNYSTCSLQNRFKFVRFKMNWRYITVMES